MLVRYLVEVSDLSIDFADSRVIHVFNAHIFQALIIHYLSFLSFDISNSSLMLLVIEEFHAKIDSHMTLLVKRDPIRQTSLYRL